MNTNSEILSKKQRIVIQNPSTKNIHIFETSFPRQIGDRVDNGNVIAIFNNREEERQFIAEWNEYVKKANAKIRRQNKQASIVAWARIFSSNPRLTELLNDLYTFKNL